MIEFATKRWVSGARLRSKAITITAIVFTAITSSTACWHYRSYALAVAWHLRHGSNLQIDGHVITLPVCWWASNDVSTYGATEVARAHSSGRIPPTLMIAPAVPGVVQQTDKKMAEIVSKAVAGIGIMESHENGADVRETTESVIASRSGNFYCEKSTVNLGRAVPEINLLCFTAGVPYSFSYDGPAEGEREVESILSTF